MSNRQIEEIKMAQVFCQQVGHQNKTIHGLCLNPECQEKAPICYNCLFNGHKNCRNYIQDVEVIPKELLKLRKVQFDILDLQEMVNKVFKDLLYQIEQILIPISKYQESPNFANLNKIAKFLEQCPELNIKNLIRLSKTQIQNLLENQALSQKQISQQQILVQNSSQQKYSKIEIQIQIQNSSFPQNIVRIKNEFRKVDDAINEGTLQNVSAEVGKKNNSQDFMKWDCVIYGREGTIWEEGEFKGTLEFSLNYPTESPIYRWKGLGQSKFYHMNVYKCGRTCIDILNYGYTPSTTILEILIGLENLLYDPNPKSPTDGDQARLFTQNKKEYDKRVKKFVQDYMKQKD